MTTLVRTRHPLETLSMNQQPITRRRSKRIAAYDEEDGDFVFTRGSKRAKTASSAPTAADQVPSAKVVAPARRATERGEPASQDHGAPTETTAKRARARKMDFATPKGAKDDGAAAPKRASRRSARLSSEAAEPDRMVAPATTVDASDLDGVDMVGAREARPVVATQNEATTISLPFSDTPVINRNKEMRKKGAAAGSRRSSLGMRGRRASSLIDHGHSAIPHKEVETAEFYKHIEADGLNEPRRMKQLLMWVGERTLGEKKAMHGDPNSGAFLAARTVQENLLKDFGEKSEFSDWFSREVGMPTKVVKKPNPRNLEIAENIAEIEARVKRLRQEKEHWTALMKEPKALPPIADASAQALSTSAIDTSLLDDEQAAILATLGGSGADDPRTSIPTELLQIQSSLEFKVDDFADAIHKVEQFQHMIGRVADTMLATSAARLQHRDRRQKEALGTRDVPMQEVLRSLSRILPESGGGGGGGGGGGSGTSGA